MTNVFEKEKIILAKEKPEDNRTEEEIIQDNIKLSKGIALKIGEYLDFLYDSAYYKHYNECEQKKPEFAYTPEDQPCIEKILAQIPEILSELAQNPKIKFIGDNNLAHVLGNSVMAEQRIVERRVTRERFEPETFAKFKKGYDFTMYYLDFIKGNDSKSKRALVMEVTTPDGWLSKFKRFYKINKIAEKNTERLQHLNFFSRLDERSSALSTIDSLKDMTAPITEDSFDKEFEKLSSKELLDKQKIREEYFSSKRIRREAA